MKTLKNPGWNRRRHSAAGYTLMELLVYGTVLLAISAVAFSALMRLWSASAQMSAATDETGAALRAAEQWRADVRAASGPIVVSERGMRCEIPTANGIVRWTHALDAVWRQLDSAPGRLLVSRVQICSFERTPRKHTTPLRCDLLLEPRSKRASQAPTFTFLAVPPTSIQALP